jgi:hypothetical protein
MEKEIVMNRISLVVVLLSLLCYDPLFSADYRELREKFDGYQACKAEFLRFCKVETISGELSSAYKKLLEACQEYLSAFKDAQIPSEVICSNDHTYLNSSYAVDRMEVFSILRDFQNKKIFCKALIENGVSPNLVLNIKNYIFPVVAKVIGDKSLYLSRQRKGEIIVQEALSK